MKGISQIDEDRKADSSHLWKSWTVWILPCNVDQLSSLTILKRSPAAQVKVIGRGGLERKERRQEREGRKARNEEMRMSQRERDIGGT